MSSRVVITGLGVVSSIGIGVSEFWKTALAGRSGITAIQSFEPFFMADYRSKVAGQVQNFSPEQYLPTSQSNRVDRYAQFALVAAKEALAALPGEAVSKDIVARLAQADGKLLPLLQGAGS